ncbi:MAG: anthranilate synthase component I family protein [Gammaproteobacteria bacterium]|nr:anthranilate synthase component I family protein [Gammaproteobacteria bacterium]
MIIIDLQFTPDLSKIFNKLSQYQWSIWLDSGKKNNQQYDIISAWPYKTILSTLSYTIIQELLYDSTGNILNKTFQRFSNSLKNPFEILKDLLPNNNAKNLFGDNIPFWHGAMGYFGYDLNQLIGSKSTINSLTTSSIPVMAIGLYSWALITDYHKQKTYLTYDEDCNNEEIIKNIISNILNYQTSNQEASNKKILNYFKNLKTNFFKQENPFHVYQNNFLKIQKHITDGDCYQINYSMRFSGYFKKNELGDYSAWDFYQYLRDLNANPFSCYFNITKDLQILSYSPERFLKVNNKLVTTHPIKGTRKNTIHDPLLNQKAIEDLLTNPKDRAENIMITDLMRNDLNKHCVPGSVKTPEVCQLHTFPTVHHLISTIQGQLKDELSSLDLLQGCFPGGSITGAPKIKAMEIIHQLENQNRYIYCGSIGYININGNLDTNIAIRTILKYGQTYYYWAGSGIVADSLVEEEYTEIFNKLIKVQ